MPAGPARGALDDDGLGVLDDDDGLGVLDDSHSGPVGGSPSKKPRQHAAAAAGAATRSERRRGLAHFKRAEHCQAVLGARGLRAAVCVDCGADVSGGVQVRCTTCPEQWAVLCPACDRLRHSGGCGAHCRGASWPDGRTARPSLRWIFLATMATMARPHPPLPPYVPFHGACPRCGALSHDVLAEDGRIWLVSVAGITSVARVAYRCTECEWVQSGHDPATYLCGSACPLGGVVTESCGY